MKMCTSTAAANTTFGLIVDVTTQSFQVPDDVLQMVQDWATDVERSYTRKGVRARELATLSGKIQSLYLAVPFDRFSRVNLHRSLA